MGHLATFGSGVPRSLESLRWPIPTAFSPVTDPSRDSGRLFASRWLADDLDSLREADLKTLEVVGLSMVLVATGVGNVTPTHAQGNSAGGGIDQRAVQRAGPNMPRVDTATESARISSVHSVGTALVEQPNDASLHRDMAVAYFKRGAMGDAVRVTAHGRRARQLDPAGDDRLTQAISRAKPGLLTRVLAAKFVELDAKVSATLAGTAAAITAPVNQLIASGLASKMARSNFRRTRTDMSENVKDLETMFEWKSGNQGDKWEERLDEVKRFIESDPTWASLVGQSLAGAFAEANILVANGPGASSGPDQSQLPPPPPIPGTVLVDPSHPVDVVSGDSEPLPNPFQLRNQAMMALIGGELPMAIDRFIQAAAVSDALLQRDVMSRKSSDPDLAGEPGSSPGGPPPPAGPPPPPPQSATAAAPPAAPAAPALPAAPAPGFSAGADQVARIGSGSMRAVEALSNPQVPPEEAQAAAVAEGAAGVAGEPLVLDMNGNGILDLHGQRWPDGRHEGPTVVFDIDGDGVVEHCEWIKPRCDGLLAFDANKNGRIDSGVELFGFSPLHVDGFARLREWDVNRDGRLTGRELRGLLVWNDDGNGVSSRGELGSVQSLGITRIDLPARRGLMDAKFVRDGRSRVIGEWWPDTRWTGGASRGGVAGRVP